MQTTFIPKITTILLIIFLHLSPLSLHSHGKNLTLLETATAANTTSAYGPWLRIKNPRSMGCRRRPWICRGDDSPRVRRRCCGDHCVDVFSDVNNCGLCGIRCPFTWQCCRGLCFNTNVNPFHCGGCFRRCRFPSFCSFGMCGHAQPIPFPFPPRPRPRPPKPYPPRLWPPGPRPPKPYTPPA